MKKNLYRILLTALSVVFALVCGVIATGCNGGDDNNNNNNNNNPTETIFTVTVVYPDGTTVDGTTEGTGGLEGNIVNVQFCSTAEDGACATPIPLGADGKVSVNVNDLIDGVTEYKVRVLGCPEGYSCNDYSYFAEGSTTITITLTADAE